jgi:hypothetical protein
LLRILPFSAASPEQSRRVPQTLTSHQAFEIAALTFKAYPVARNVGFDITTESP